MVPDLTVYQPLNGFWGGTSYDVARVMKVRLEDRILLPPLVCCTQQSLSDGCLVIAVGETPYAVVNLMYEYPLL